MGNGNTSGISSYSDDTKDQSKSGGDDDNGIMFDGSGEEGQRYQTDESSGTSKRSGRVGRGVKSVLLDYLVRKRV